MRRAACAAALVLAACAPEVGQPLFPREACRVVELIDAGSGAAVSGVEDIAWDPASRTLYVSAYDRLSVERADRAASAPEPPTGGLYALPQSALDGPVRVRVEDLIAPTLGRPGRPHGLDVKPRPEGGVRIAAVNRAFARGPNQDWQVRPELLILDAGGAAEPTLVARVLSPELCRANDVAWTPEGRAAVTLDRGVCTRYGGATHGGGALAFVSEDGALDFAPAPASFPNGVAVAQDGIWIADTLGKRLTLADDARRIAMPGAPDNLSLDARGRIIAALHPSLARFTPYRFGWSLGAAAPSRVVRFDPRRGTLAVLYDDPDGGSFAGATAAVAAGDKLILGGVREQGILVCESAGDSG